MTTVQTSRTSRQAAPLLAWRACEYDGASGYLNQGIGVVTGLQDKFSWKNVAASAVGAGVGQLVAPAMGDVFGKGTFGARLATGLIAGTAAAVARGGRVTIQQVAVDAMGNALAESFVDAMQPSDPLGDFINEKVAAQERRDMYSLATGRESLGLRTTGRGGLGARFSEDAVFEWAGNVDNGIKTAAANLPAIEPVAAGSFLDTAGRMLRAQTGYSDVAYGAGSGWEFTQTGGGNQRQQPQMARSGGAGDAAAQLISDPWGLLGPGMTGGYADVRSSLARHDIKTQIEDIRFRLSQGGVRNVPDVGSALFEGGRAGLDYSPEQLERFKIMENFDKLRRQGIVELDANWRVTSVASGRQMLINPMDIRFSQKSVSYMSSDGVNNLDTTGQTARVSPERIDPMDVVVMPDGRLTSVDNRRLTAGQLYDANKVNVVIRGSADPLTAAEARRFSWEQFDAKTWGDAVLIRVFRQGQEFREAFRVGSPVVPLIKHAPINPLYQQYQIPPQRRR